MSSSTVFEVITWHSKLCFRVLVSSTILKGVSHIYKLSVGKGARSTSTAIGFKSELTSSSDRDTSSDKLSSLCVLQGYPPYCPVKQLLQFNTVSSMLFVATWWPFKNHCEAIGLESGEGKGPVWARRRITIIPELPPGWGSDNLSDLAGIGSSFHW